MTPITTGDSFDLNFTTKAELLENAFYLFGDVFTNDYLLDRCNAVWEKQMKLEEWKAITSKINTNVTNTD